MQRGDAFMLDDDDEAKEHLHVVLTNPTAEGEVVTVAICTRKRWSEDIVCLEIGDHPFIRHSSVVAYRYARIRKCSAIEQALACGKARSKERISQQLLRRIQQALPESDFVSNEVRAFFTNCDLE
ncbi:MAG: hypothetical protein P4L40_22070 [Terracidiphilus sp.]|nr:hypothetical protein [Terracidiphilus sp.]